MSEKETTPETTLNRAERKSFIKGMMFELKKKK